MIRRLVLCWIIMSTVNAFAAQNQAGRKLSAIEASPPRGPHEPRGIAHSAATIALAGVVWSSVASGLPVIPPAAASATDSQIAELLATKTTIQEDLSVNIDHLGDIKEDLDEINVKDIGKISAASSSALPTENIDVVVTSAPTIQPAAAVSSGPQLLTEIVNKLDSMATKEDVKKLDETIKSSTSAVATEVQIEVIQPAAAATEALNDIIQPTAAIEVIQSVATAATEVQIALPTENIDVSDNIEHLGDIKEDLDEINFKDIGNHVVLIYAASSSTTILGNHYLIKRVFRDDLEHSGTVKDTPDPSGKRSRTDEYVLCLGMGFLFVGLLMNYEF
jgi:hypothetical protein